MVSHSVSAPDFVPPVPTHLSRSRWATPQPTARTRARARTPAERVAQEKHKADRLLRRLYWKGESLRSSYKRAIDILRCDIQHDGPSVASQYSFLLGPGTDEASWMQAKRMAENMFKVDFFEFYAVLEKFITLCLSFFGISVSSSSLGQNVNALRQASSGTPISSTTSATEYNSGSWHSFHANLLDKVGDESCPLHEALGNQDVFIQLRLAKDYRNQWKNADDEDAESNGYHNSGPCKRVVKLEDLKLDEMVRTLLTGCFDAYCKIKGEESFNTNPAGRVGGEMEIDMEETDMPYEAVGDAMEIDFEI